MPPRYLYLDSSGNLQGPLWLSQMRELFALGRLTKRTEVCPNGQSDWGVLENFPEITSLELTLQRDFGTSVKTERQRYEGRMWRWLVILLGLYAIYALISFR